VKQLAMLDDRPAARDDEIVDIRRRGRSRPHARRAMVVLIGSAGEEPIEREKTPAVMVRRFLRVDFLQAKNIGREFVQQGFRTPRRRSKTARRAAE